MILCLAAACGSQHAAPSSQVVPPSSTAGSPTPKPTLAICPQVPGVSAPPSCVSVSTEQEQKANQTFNSRIPLPASVAAQAAPMTRRVQESLESLTPAQRLSVTAVRAALLAAGTQSVDLVVFSGSPYNAVAFGGYELLDTTPPVCVWGTVSVKSVELDSGGITREGGCLETSGGH